MKDISDKKIVKNDVLRILDQISNELLSVNDQILRKKQLGLLGGMSGIALFFFYYSRYKESQELSNYAKSLMLNIFNKIDDDPNIIGHDYAEGRCGIFATLHHISVNKFIDNDFFIYEESVDLVIYKECINYIKRDNMDFFYGSGGLLYLLYLRFKCSKSNLLKKYILDIIDELCINKSPSLIFFNSEQRVNEQVEISIPHGISSWIIILSKIKECLEYNKIDYVLKNMFNYYEPFIRLNKILGSSYFPSVISNNFNYNDINTMKSRLGWCYGDIPCLLASMCYLENTSDMEHKNKVLRMLVSTSKRMSLHENSIFDAGLCHGSSGLFLVFNKLNEKYELSSFRQASIFWMNNIKSFNHEDRGFCKEYLSNGNIISSKEYGFLEGLSGIGLSLLYCISNKYGNWRELMLL